MYTALRATSLTLRQFLAGRLAPLFGGGGMTVSLLTPKEMSGSQQGLSLWLYRIVRDEMWVNNAPERISVNRVRRTPLPTRVHYLMTPIVDNDQGGPETEQAILGRVLQSFYDYPTLLGSTLQDDFRGTGVELSVRLETMSLEEITRVWHALEEPYRLSISYEVSVVTIQSEREPEDIVPVTIPLPEYAEIVNTTA
jgi:hypothetical protein